ncbi:MAG: hypothetical protein WBA93_21350 [Microcoleaceae cyanobacterium]
MDKLVIILWILEPSGVTKSGKYYDYGVLQNRNARLIESFKIIQLKVKKLDKLAVIPRRVENSGVRRKF